MNGRALPPLPGVPVRVEPPIPPAVARRAVEWLVELQAGAVPPAVRAGWQRWRAEHPDHERAWQRIESVNGHLQALASPVNAAIAQATLAPPRSMRRRRAVTGLAVLLFSGAGAWTVWRQEEAWRAQMALWRADQRTAVGERRRLVLEDGSTLQLNSGSAIQLAYGAAERRLRLLAGEVLVQTAADPAGRPFLIESAEGEARALGTRYSVRQLPQATQVAVYEGAVRLVPRGVGAPVRELQAGEEASFTLAGLSPVRASDPDRAAWTEGFIVARGLPLGELLAELGRHSARPLSCDPAIAGLRVSGSYPLADIDKVLEALSAALSLDIETVTRFWGLRTEQVRLVPRRS